MQFGKLYPHDLQACAKLTRGQMLVYMALVLHSDQNRSCWPSQSTIAKRTGLSRQTVIRSLRALEAAGLVARTHRGGRAVKAYQLRKPMDCANVNPEGYIKDSDVTFGTVDVTSEGYTNKEQLEQIYILDTSSELALGWPETAQRIRAEELSRNGSGTMYDSRFILLRSFSPVGMRAGRTVIRVRQALQAFSEDVRPSVAAVLGHDPVYIYDDGERHGSA